MKLSVIIGNFNYARFLSECMGSVLRQSYPNFELIIVDDGSTDDSWRVMSSFADTRLLTVRKTNAGQLSCFNRAVDLVSGDVVAFLDSDDTYAESYLERLRCHYLSHADCDFAFCGMNVFGDQAGTVSFGSREINCGRTAALTYFLRAWIGAPTSSLSMRTKTLKAVLPLPGIEADWRTRADDVLVWGSSLAGATKYYLPEILVNYRVHGANQFYGKGSAMETDDRRRRVKAFFDDFAARRDRGEYERALSREPLQGIWPFSTYDRCFKVYRARNRMGPAVAGRMLRYRVFKLGSLLLGKKPKIDEAICNGLLCGMAGGTPS